MIKEDVQWLVLALGILVVVALVIAPVATGQPPNLGISLNFTLPSLPPLETVTVVTTEIVTTVPTTLPATTATPVPTMLVATTQTPAPATTVLVWNGSGQTVGFVDPGTYNVSFTTFVPRHSEYIPEFSNQSGNQTPYRTVNYTSLLTNPITGQWSGTTQVIDIPFPYWEIWYTLEPASSDLSKQAEGTGSYVIQPTQGQGVSMSGVSGSYSTAVPFFSIDVVDADNPSRFVTTITPPGSLDPVLLKKYDPRPWKEKIFEGRNSYYLVITARHLASYSIDIKIPNSYLGKI